MTKEMDFGPGRPDVPASEAELRADSALREALGVLDPETMDPGYWVRFRAGVMRVVAPELARRRGYADMSVTEVLSAWARPLVPIALMAAAAAGVLLLKEKPATRPQPLMLDEILVQELDEAPLPAALNGSGGGTSIAFAMERF
ncbi:MAG: hypothetical protein ACE5GJ_00145 [Gemmatimonadota bacterium]